MTAIESSKLLESVRTTCGALNLGRQHAAMVAVAETLARTVDQLVTDDRPQPLGQTVPPLIRVLEQLAAAGPVQVAPRGLTDAGLRLLLGEEGEDGAA